MNWGTVFALVLLAVAAIFFVTEKLRADLVGLIVLIALGVSRVLTPEEAFSGFSRSAVITILSIFIFTAVLQKTGVTRTLGVLLLRLGGHTERRILR
jgi:di/tricarboxylate transporter